MHARQQRRLPTRGGALTGRCEDIDLSCMRLQVLFVEGHNVQLLDNPGNLAEESAGNLDDLGLPPMERRSSGFKRQATFFEKNTRALSDDEEEEKDEEVQAVLDEAAAAAGAEGSEEGAPVGESALSELSSFCHSFVLGAEEWLGSRHDM